MADNIQQQNDKKTVVAFIVGLLIGGLLVWAFSGPDAEAPVKKVVEEESIKNEGNNNKVTGEDVVVTEPKRDANGVATLPVGDGAVSVTETTAGTKVMLASATFPTSEGWVGVREYTDEKLGGLLGVSRFSEEQGLVPTEIILLRPTRVGTQYAVVMYSENGDRKFNLANDVQVDKVYTTFTAK